jgi:hypothetical protein
MPDPADPFPELEEHEDDASYSWWLNTHPSGYVLAVRARHPPMLHRARCSDVDRDRRPGRLKAKGARQLCADNKTALRAWLAREMPDAAQIVARCPKCAP